MSWQDLVFSVGSWIFTASLIPTIRGKQKPEFVTSAVTVIVLFAFAATYLSLGLKLGALSVFVNALFWAVLAYQRWTQPKK